MYAKIKSMRKAHVISSRVRKPKKSSRLNFLVVFLLVLGGLALIFFLGKFIYSNFVPNSNLAEHLPAEETVAYLELEDVELPEKLNSQGAQEKLLEALHQYFQFDLKPALEGFGTGKVAYALMDVEGEANKPILFVEAKSKSAAQDYFKSLMLESETLESSEDEKEIFTFSQGQPYYFRFFDRFVALSSESEVLEKLSETGNQFLSQNANYQKTINNLPRDAWMIGYLNVSKLQLEELSGLKNILEPLKPAVHNFGIAVRKNEDGFHFNTFLNVNKDLLPAGTPEEGTFTHELTDFLPADNIALYVGGRNLAEEWQSTLETISNLNPSYGLILEGLLRAQTDKAFGAEVDLRNDLYPLFEEEYALMLGDSDQGKEVELILAHNDQAFVERKMEKMAQGFETIASTFEPKVSVVSLPDGTESRELVPDDTSIEKTDKEIAGHQTYCTKVGTKTAFCYAVTEDKVLMTNSEKLLEKSLTKSADMLSSTTSFASATENLSHVTDEITYLNFDRFIAYFEEKPILQLLKPMTANLDSATWVKQYFDDGVSSEGYVLLK